MGPGLRADQSEPFCVAPRAWLTGQWKSRAEARGVVAEARSRLPACLGATHGFRVQTYPQGALPGNACPVLPRRDPWGLSFCRQVLGALSSFSSSMKLTGLWSVPLQKATTTWASMHLRSDCERSLRDEMVSPRDPANHARHHLCDRVCSHTPREMGVCCSPGGPGPQPPCPGTATPWEAGLCLPRSSLSSQCFARCPTHSTHLVDN